jgi:hypothetical protein
MTNIRSGLTALAIAVAICLIDSTIGHSQIVLSPRWFQIGPPDIDQVGNEAVDHLSSGMSSVILALSAGRQRHTPVGPEQARQAIGEFKSSLTGFQRVEEKIAGRRINLETIRNAGYEKTYDSLVSLLKQQGYDAPVDGKTFIELLTTIINRSVNDLDILIANSKTPAGQRALQEAFIDIVQQKMLLEQIGAISGIITTAMQ